MRSIRGAIAVSLLMTSVGAFAQLLPADENGVKSTLRAIASAQITYSVACNTGFYYAPSLEALAKPEPGKKAGFLNPTDVPAKGAKFLEKWHYRVEMTAPADPKSPASCNGVPAGGSAKTWSATARPMPGYRGKSYRINEEGVISEIQ